MISLSFFCSDSDQPPIPAPTWQEVFTLTRALGDLRRERDQLADDLERTTRELQLVAGTLHTSDYRLECQCYGMTAERCDCCKVVSILGRHLPAGMAAEPCGQSCHEDDES